METLLNFTKPIDLFFEGEITLPYNVNDKKSKALNIIRSLKIKRIVKEKKKTKDNQIMYEVIIEDYYPEYKEGFVSSNEFKTFESAKDDFEYFKWLAEINKKEKMFCGDRYFWRFMIVDNEFVFQSRYVCKIDGKWV